MFAVKPRKANMQPEHDNFQKGSPLPGLNFQVACACMVVYAMTLFEIASGWDLLDSDVVYGF